MRPIGDQLAVDTENGNWKLEIGNLAGRPDPDGCMYSTNTVSQPHLIRGGKSRYSYPDIHAPQVLQAGQENADIKALTLKC